MKFTLSRPDAYRMAKVLKAMSAKSKNWYVTLHTTDQSVVLQATNPYASLFCRFPAEQIEAGRTTGKFDIGMFWNQASFWQFNSVPIRFEFTEEMCVARDSGFWEKYAWNPVERYHPTLKGDLLFSTQSYRMNTLELAHSSSSHFVFHPFEDKVLASILVGSGEDQVTVWSEVETSYINPEFEQPAAIYTRSVYYWLNVHKALFEGNNQPTHLYRDGDNYWFTTDDYSIMLKSSDAPAPDISEYVARKAAPHFQATIWADELVNALEKVYDNCSIGPEEVTACFTYITTPRGDWLEVASEKRPYMPIMVPITMKSGAAIFKQPVSVFAAFKVKAVMAALREVRKHTYTVNVVFIPAHNTLLFTAPSLSLYLFAAAL